MKMINKTELYDKTFKLLRHHVSNTFRVPTKQLPRIMFHGLILACIIAGFWLLDSLKDPILANTVGIEYQPMAKLLSVISTLFIVCIYDFLTSLVSKPTLFHIVSGVFGMVFMVLSALLSDKQVGLDNPEIGPHRFLGWVSYFMIEAYGSLMVALFWSFTNSIMDLEQAKGAYGLIISVAQIGAILGSTLATNAGTIGISQLFLMGAIMIFCVSLLIKTYHLLFHDYETESHMDRVRSISESTSTDDAPLMMAATREGSLLFDSNDNENLIRDFDGSSTALLVDSAKASHKAASDKKKVAPSLWQSTTKVFGGFHEGLSLIIRHTYILKLLGVSCLYEVVVTILDYQFKVMGAHSVAKIALGEITSLTTQGDRFANLLGHFGQVTNFLSFIVSFFGFSYFVHNIGVSKSLLIFPILLFAAVVIINLVPSLWVLFMFVSIIKALIFSLHDPVKELLYIPTSDAIKFKAKAWVDVFGSRFAKALGSLITSLSRGDARTLRSSGEIPCLVFSALIILTAWSIGRDFEQLIESNTIVGDDRPGVHHNQVKESFPQGGLPIVAGRKPGEVGYDGYDLHLFEGVFSSEDEEEDEVNAVERRRRRQQREQNVKKNNSKHQHQQQSSYTSMKQYKFPEVNPNSSNRMSNIRGDEQFALQMPKRSGHLVSSNAGEDSPNTQRIRAQSAQL